MSKFVFDQILLESKSFFADLAQEGLGNFVYFHMSLETVLGFEHFLAVVDVAHVHLVTCVFHSNV